MSDRTLNVALEGLTLINHARKPLYSDPGNMDSENLKSISRNSRLSCVPQLSMQMHHLLQSKTESSVELDSSSFAPIIEYRETERTKFFTRIAVRLGDRFVPIHLQQVFWIQSKGNLLCIHLQDANYDCRITMKELSLKLDPNCFLRVHRNAIVNLDHVVEFDLPRFGNAFVHLRNGKALPISRTGRMALRRNLLPRSFVNANNVQNFERFV
jgi:DNA-binding LytR/AlgR family response regulator